MGVGHVRFQLEGALDELQRRVGLAVLQPEYRGIAQWHAQGWVGGYRTLVCHTCPLAVPGRGVDRGQGDPGPSVRGLDLQSPLVQGPSPIALTMALVDV